MVDEEEPPRRRRLRIIRTEESEPVLPYGPVDDPNSGAAGSETSRLRAAEADRSGVTARRQTLALQLLAMMGADGATWRELSEYGSMHHGASSGALSNLHKAGRIARLTQTRQRCRVYVLPGYVNGRDVEPHGQTSTTLLLARAVGVLRKQGPCRQHPGNGHVLECARCEGWAVVRQYDAINR